MYLFFGPIFATTTIESAIHLFATVIAVAHWLTNNNQCIWTQILNRQCSYPETDSLDSIKNVILSLFGRPVAPHMHYVWIAGLAVYDMVVLGKLIGGR